ncbi:hypothetical protein B0I08_104260 [Glaciihabitans tibetensis]|uniref:Lipoprotein n=2 Tax=Glaciihabitans tibetensis TaxID=1266600 RepID=A0A2T0VEF0_9MICO|nr:hypothetical protein B0I08_104260 [Glaciihabitans tibetensis]
MPRLATASVIALIALGLSGCSTAGLFGDSPLSAASDVETTAPAPTAEPLVFNSVFTDMGSVHQNTMVANELQLQLDMWTEQKTHEWFTDAQKSFSFVIDVTDMTVPVEAPFASKRQVFMSSLSVTATTTTTSGVVETPLVLSVNPVDATLDPEALSSPYGLLITSPKGGLQMVNNVIGPLVDDTYGLILDFSMIVSSEATPGTGSYVTQTIHQTVPVAIFPRV